MSVYKPPQSRYWRYDFQYQTRRFHGSTACETRRQAEAVERRKRQQAAMGELDLADIPTLNQAASRWSREKAEGLGTADTVWNRIKINLRLLGKDTLITDITTTRVDAAIQRRRETYAQAKGPKAKRYCSRSTGAISASPTGTPAEDLPRRPAAGMARRLRRRRPAGAEHAAALRRALRRVVLPSRRLLPRLRCAR